MSIVSSLNFDLKLCKMKILLIFYNHFLLTNRKKADKKKKKELSNGLLFLLVF